MSDLWVKRVDFTITRSDIWPWVKAIFWTTVRGEYRVHLHLDPSDQSFIEEYGASTPPRIPDPEA